MPVQKLQSKVHQISQHSISSLRYRFTCPFRALWSYGRRKTQDGLMKTMILRPSSYHMTDIDVQGHHFQVRPDAF